MPDKRANEFKRKFDFECDTSYKTEMKKDIKDRMTLLIIAYHNLAVE